MGKGGKKCVHTHWVRYPVIGGIWQTSWGEGERVKERGRERGGGG